MSELLITQVSDFNEVCSVLEQAAVGFEEMGYELWPAEAITPEALESVHPGAKYYIGRISDQAVAAMLLMDYDPEFWENSENDSALYLHKLAVIPSQRRQGLAQRMLDAACTECRTQEVDFLRIDCSAHQLHLKPFYINYGFQLIREHQWLHPMRGMMDLYLFELEVS